MTGLEYYNLGLSYAVLDVLNKDMDAAIMHFQSSAETGFADAYYFLGRIFSIGDGVSKNLELSLIYYKKGLELGSFKCGFGLGMMYFMGAGIEKDEHMAMEYFKQHYQGVQAEALKNDPVSLYLIGLSHYYGIYVQRYVLEAVKWFLKSASYNYSDAQYMLGMIYETIDVKNAKNQADAIFYYELASKQGHMYATFALALIHIEKNNLVDAKKCLQAASKQNYALASFTLGLFYEEHEPKNRKQAFDEFYKASLSNHDQAMYKVGLYYHKGLGIEKNMTEAIKWYQKAALLNNLDAIYQLGMIELMKENKEIKMAIKYLEQAASMNHPYAQYNLAVIYQKGDGVELDFNKAFYYFKQSAEKGFSQAQYNLGMMYYRGDGTQKDDSEAKKWWKKAADQGFSEAVELLRSIDNYEVLQKSKHR